MALATRPRTWTLPPLPLPEGRLTRLLFEISVLSSGLLSYHLVRGAVNGRVEEAVNNAHELIGFEKGLGFFWETHLQSLITGHAFLVNFFNGVYIWGHLPVIGVLAAWIFVFRQECFARYRNAFLISGAIGLVFFIALPVAPPRLVPGAGFVDTVTLNSNAYRVLQPTAFVNQYAALPSLHFGWNLLVGIALFQSTRAWYARAFALVMPLVMLAAVVLTANHYILDVFVGGIIALAAIWLATRLHRNFERTRGHAVLV